ncbi:Tubulointerstitial nephritis antigen-like protein, partial [Stegodyphus mimosarum]
LLKFINIHSIFSSFTSFLSLALASDRLAIESLGVERMELSPQHLLSCQKRGQRACHGGHLDKAWY